MDNIKNRVSVVNLSQIDLPKFTENRSSEWIKYGEDNMFPNRLQDLANRSALHNAIISSKVDNICGNGLTYDKNKHTRTDEFMENPNPYDTVDDFFRKIAYDYILYGGYAIKVNWSKSREKIAEMHHIDFANIRCGKKDSDGQITTFWYSKDWTQYRKTEYTPIKMVAFNEQTKKEEPIQLLYIKEYRPGQDYYPLPSYVGALAYIDIDTEISNFHLAHIRNGMTPSIMINFNNGVPTDAERKLIEKQISNKYNGTDNAGKFILTFSDDSTKAPTVSTLTPSQLDKQFIQLQDTVLQNILSGHKVVSPMIVGIKTPGSLGGSAELETAFYIYEKTIIKPAQDILLRTLNKIGAINKLQPLYVIPSSPIEFQWSENVLSTILTKDEMRERIGLEPLKETIDPLTQNNS